MNLLGLLIGGQSVRVKAVAKEASQRSCPAVWGLVQHRALAMSAAEACGYIRAHASATVGQEVDSALRRHRDVDALHRPQIVEAAKEGVVNALLVEVLRIQKTALQRRAA